MNSNHTFYIIGAGLAGCVISNRLASAGKSVVVFEKRDHVGGNAYDYVDDYGINVHKYGPHIFHTNKDEVYNYLSKFTEFIDFNLVCGSEIDGKTVRTSFDFSSIDTFFPDEADEIKTRIKSIYGDAKSATILELLEAKDELIKKFAVFLYEKDYAPYTAKQWGISVDEIDKQIFRRVPILFSYDSKYFSDKYQGMPKDGYTAMCENMLKHNNIKTILNTDAMQLITLKNDTVSIKGYDENCYVIFTGMIDELLGFQYGKLPYRSLFFEFNHEDIDSFQDYPVVAYPQAEKYTRITEYKKLPVQNVKGTTYAIEYPVQYEKSKGNLPYYPILTEDSKKSYEKYLHTIEKYNNIALCGRLAEFKYYNMDEVVWKAIEVSDKLLKGE